MTTPQPNPSPKNPTELLDAQLLTMNKLLQLQIKQYELLEKALTRQTELTQRLAKAVDDLANKQPAERKLALPDELPVTVRNFNMPFTSLVGFLIKSTLAALPASIVIGIIFGLLWGLVFIIFAGLVGRR